MNEQKLKELWWKARIGYNEQNCDPEVLEKFAELIVRECIEIAGYYDKGSDDGWDRCALSIALHLETHFELDEDEE